MEKYNTSEIPKSSRITRLVDHLYAKMPEIESYRAKLITESYKETEDQPIITRRAKAFSHIFGILIPVAGRRAGYGCYQNCRSVLYLRAGQGRPSGSS